MLRGELPPAERRHPVVARALALVRQCPRSGDPPFCLETIQSWIKRARFHLQQIFGGSLYVLRNRVAVAWPGKQRPEDQKVERPAEQLEARFNVPSHSVEALHIIV